jgi:hypothetical protein
MAQKLLYFKSINKLNYRKRQKSRQNETSNNSEKASSKAKFDSLILINYIGPTKNWRMYEDFYNHINCSAFGISLIYQLQKG